MPKSETESLTKQFQELERIAEKMQDPRIDIEENLDLFEKGMAIAAKAEERLKALENKVKVLKKKYRVNTLDNPSEE